MRLLVRMHDPRETVRIARRRWIARYRPQHFATFETTVTKLIRRDSISTIYAYGFMPEKYAPLAIAAYYQPDGTYLFDVVINHNRKTLMPFVESGLLEMDVREIES
jgi:hypothetical protein